ncbi:Hypothetical Protein FCC1311_066012 [Hondaea fermentalgiana]|uniref:WW domain-containing protein n=1 Tax=Hondaea fermentalgiana TaxID=2315210 RepID=A0A2R5GHM5_9STRA|nr:Hypothetical Protein FCC1311_066012 [Hondaea fermentalgiana]|eukprot:GBG30382.1 Hypothetical Protein FCC1311_066012 [Hondaea fermentalgiana]
MGGDGDAVLPAGWKEAWSRSKGKKYYSNARRNLSLWSLGEVLRYEATAQAEQQQQQQQQKDQAPSASGAEAAPGAAENVLRVAAFPADTAKDLDALEAFVQETCKAFMANEKHTDLVFPPCAEDKRYIINEAADDFGLVPESSKKDMGAYIGTFITLFKPGHSTREKRDAKVMADAEARVGQDGDATSANPRKRVRVDEPPAAAPQDAVTKLGTVARDRRTIEEIQKLGDVRNRPASMPAYAS